MSVNVMIRLHWSYMNWHVEVVRLKMVCHLSKALKCVLTHSLLKPKRLPGLAALLKYRRIRIITHHSKDTRHYG